MTELKCTPVKRTVQDVMIDLPGETIQCWRSSDNIRVILRKQRDVFFDINLQPGRTYTVESKCDFYVPKTKKLVRKAQFNDGEPFHLWVGREFKSSIVLKAGSTLIGTFEPNVLDPDKYAADPKVKPEPLLVVMGKRDTATEFSCTPQDAFGAGSSLSLFKHELDPKVALLKDLGTKFDYKFNVEPPTIAEYACIAEALPHEIQPQVLMQLDSGVAVVDTYDKIFVPPTKGQKSSDLYSAIAAAAAYISGNSFLTANAFKETAGYLQEHWRALNRISMRVRIEKRVKGKYRVIFKGRPLTRVVAEAFGTAAQSKVKVEKMPFGHANSAFVDGGFERSGKAGYGGLKRIMLTARENFKSGMKIQIIGTVIDIIGDANTVFGDEKGSRDLSEFLGRAGISIAKAGVTAAIGSALAAGFVALITAFVGAAGIPVLLTVGIVVAGYIVAATIVDMADERLNIKNTVAGWAR